MEFSEYEAMQDAVIFMLDHPIPMPVCDCSDCNYNASVEFERRIQIEMDAVDNPELINQIFK